MRAKKTKATIPKTVLPETNAAAAASPLRTKERKKETTVR
jgi:hypothetical protein